MFGQGFNYGFLGSPRCLTDTTDIFEDNSAIALYNLDYDASDNGNATGKFDEGAVFNGSSSKITLPSSGTTPIDLSTENWAVSLWFKQNARATTTIFSKWGSGTANVAFIISVLSSDNTKLYIGQKSTSGATTATIPSQSFDINVWNHLVVTRSSTQTIVYLNNIKEEFSTTDNVQQSASTPFIIGAQYGTGGGTSFFNGSIDQVRLFNRTISTLEAAALYNETKNTTNTLQILGDTSCIATYTLDGSSTDLSGNYNGTDTNVIYKYDAVPTDVEFGVGGQINYGARFNGSSSKIELPSALSDGSTTAATCISFWFNVGAEVTSSTTSNEIMQFAGTSSLTGKIALGSTSGHMSGETFSVTHNVSGVYTYSQTNIPAGWNHAVVQWNSSDGKWDIYINSVKHTTYTVGTNAQGYFKLKFGNRSSVYYTGSLDQVRLFNRTISTLEVAALYNETKNTTNTLQILGDTSCIATYTLDGSSTDLSGNYNGTDTNVIYKYDAVPTDVEFGVGGQINYGARFNGSSSKIELPSALSDGSTTAATCISFWFNVGAEVTSSTTSNEIMQFAGTSSLTGKIALGSTSGHMSGETFSVTHNVSGVYTYSQTNIPAGWNHAVVQWNSSDGKWDIYINSVKHTTYTVGTNAQGYFKLKFGNRSSVYYTGSLDQVRIFSKALNQSEVDTLYAEQACVHTATTTDNDFPTTNLAYYKLDNSAEDETTNANDGTETSITYEFGRYGQAAVFNTTSSAIGSFAAQSLTTRTISLWVKFTSFSAGQFLFDTNDRFQSTNAYGNWAIQITNQSGSNNTRFVYARYNGSQYGYMYKTISWSLNTWYHIVFQASANNHKVWINGTEETGFTTQRYSTLATTNMNLLKLGNEFLGTSVQPLTGSLDQIRIFSSELTNSQVTELYNEKPETDASNFKTVLYEGNGGTQYISNVGMDLETNGGLVWIKNRDTNNIAHVVYDSVRGVGLDKMLHTNGTVAEGDTFFGDDALYGYLTSIDSNGFTVTTGSTSASYVNNSTINYVAWVWKGGGDAVSNTDGSITSQVSANADAGFSIVSYTGSTSSSNLLDSVGHGLSSAPEMVIYKSTSNGGTPYFWEVWHKDLTNDNYYLQLDKRDGETLWTDIPNRGDKTNQFTSTTFPITYTSANGVSGLDYIAYCFHSVSGYSRISTYEGDGTTDNKIYTTDDDTSTGSNGFKPSFVMLKNIDRDNTGWLIHDTARDPVNTSYHTILANANTQEYTSTSYWLMDFESDGFRLKYGADNEFNRSGDTYIYMAFK